MIKKTTILTLFCCYCISIYSQERLNKTEITILESAPKDGILRILQTTNPQDSFTLRQKATEIDFADTNLLKLQELMLQTVKDTANSGVGLAAPQIGILKRIFLIQRFDKIKEPFDFILNPTINWSSNLIQNGREGCLSIPDTMAMVDRHYAINVSYQNTHGQWITENLEGFTAIIFQHEYDHLNGILFLDRIDEQQKRSYFPTNQSFQYLENKNTR